jgi:oxalate---CoA ligase
MAQVLSDLLSHLLATGADSAPALSAPGRQPLRYDALRALIDRSLATLNGVGIARNDRVAIVLPNGPEMAACFVACASGVASAPLNPAYRADEFEFYLDRGARQHIAGGGSGTQARRAPDRTRAPA